MTDEFGLVWVAYFEEGSMVPLFWVCLFRKSL